MLIRNVGDEITLFDGSILFLCVQKIMLYCSGAVACGHVPCKRAERFLFLVNVTRQVRLYPKVNQVSPWSAVTSFPAVCFSIV